MVVHDKDKLTTGVAIAKNKENKRLEGLMYVTKKNNKEERVSVNREDAILY